MASFNIYHKDGSPLKDSNGKDITAHSLEYNGTWMGECFVSITFENEAPIDFSIGDYVMYREERFEINYDPGKIKCASKDTYGGAFRYESVKFNSLSDELVRCDMLDLVLYDNNIHYTALPQFTFYIESIDDLLDRIQANLDELYGKAAWKLYSRNKERSIQRGGTAEGWDETYGEGTPDNVIDSTSIQISDQNCWEALSLVNSQFDINFIIRNRNVYVGTAGLPTANIFKYGKDKGLYEIEQNSESDQAIVTRLRAYGSNRNLPSHYYADLGSIPFLNITGDYHEGSTDNGLSVMMEDSLYSGMFTNVISDNGSNLKHCSIRGRIDGYEFDGELELVKKDALKSTTRLLVEVKAVSDAIKSKIDMGFVQVDFLKGANKSKFAGNRINYVSNLPNNMACDRLMLPGFPNESLSEWWDRQTEEKKAWLNPGGKSHIFSTNKYRPYVDSLNIESIGIRPSSAFFDQEDKTNGIIEIYPTIEEMEVDGVRIDEIYRGTMVYDDGRFGDGETVGNIDIYLSPSINFDINELKQDDFSISMKDGMCAGRTFKVASSRKMEDGSWRLTIEREKDDSIGLYFPYKDFQINKGDHFVLVDIEMPDAYVDAASEKLLKYCIAYLDKNDYTRYVYQPKVDEIFMARQHDKAMADESGLTKSLYLNIKEGDIMLFNDEDLGIDAEITIDQLTIKEEDGKIPTYEIVLREEKEVGTIQKIQNQISSIQNGNGGTAAGGSYSTTQIKDIVDAVGSEKFLSKITSDTAQGLITFIKGLVAEGRITANEGIRIGDFVTGFIGGMGANIDKEGNAEMKSLRLREFLEVPELRNNRIDVVSGELWNSICFGTIESVDTKRRIAVLKLQDGELSGIKVGDICRGIFHCLEGSNPTESKEDDCGFLQLAGFSTSYFTPVEVYDNGASFKYTLRSGTSVHPQVGMKFAVYGSFTDKTRRASAYMTRTYTRYLNNVDTWQIRPDVHIYGQQGDIEGLTINGVEMHGYGAYLHNLYLSGVHIEFDRDWIDHNMPKTYNVVLTTYERTVVTDIEGNPLTGLEEIRNIISEDGNVVSGESNVIANRLALTTTIQASKGSTPLLYSDIMDEGRFVVSLQCIGCTAKCENGVVMVTSLDMESMEHQVVIEVNCEGEAVYQQIFNVPVVKQGENGVTADLDNEMATIAANDKGKPIVEPFEEIVSHGRLWYGNEEMYLVKAEVAVPGGITVADVTRVTDEEGQHNYLPIVDNKYCTLRITNVGEDAADISQIRIELFGRIKEQMNTEYSKVVVFTLNKVRMGENAQNYSLLTTSPIMQADGKGNVTTTQVACSVLASDGKTMTELTTAEELKEHTLTMKVQLYNANDAVSEDVAYTIGTNLVVGTSTIGGLKLTKDSVRLVFLLYWQGLLIDKEGIPMIKDGSSTVRIDLDNENDSILYDGNGKALTDPCVTNITVWDGGKNVTSQCTISVEDSSGVEGEFSNDSHTQYRATAITAQTGYVRFKAYYPADKNSYNTVFSLKRIVGADKYEIVTMPTSVNYDPNKKEYSASSITVNVNRIDQGGTRTENSLPSGFSLQYSTDGSLWTAMAAGAGISPDYTKPNIYLRVVDSNGNVYDAETVNVMIGGLDGVAITSVKEFYCISSSNSSAPDASLFVDYFVAPTSYNRYLWNFERVFYSDGKTQDTTPAVIGTYAEDGADGRSITGVVEQYGLSSDKNTQPTSWYSYPLTTDSVNRYLWNREYCQFSDGSSTAWTIPCIIGVYGDKGDTGETGAPGQNGVTYDIVTDISTMWPYTDGVNVSIRKTDGVNVSTISLANIQSYGMSLRAYINATNISNYIEYTSDSQIYWGSNVSVVIGNVLKIQLVNGISSYTQVLAEKTIPCIGYGYNGSQGDRGPALRGPQYWDNLPSGYEFYKGASGEQFIDVVMYKGEFYLCTGSHSKSSSYYPGSYYSNLYGYWTKGSQFELIATKVILSEYALINNLGASAIEMKDSNGNVVFLAKDGNVTCNNGTFNNVSVNGTINSNEGNIGGFTLGSNSLTSDKGDAYISFPLTGSSFLHLNAPTAGALISARNDGGKACSLSAYGNNSFGLDIMAQAGYNTMALQSYGNANLVARNGEQIKVTGLNVSVHTITSSSDTIKGCDDFVVFSTGSSGTYAMPSASSYPGKVIYVKKLSGSSMTGLTGNFRKPESSTGTTSETFCAEGVSMMYISDGTRWNVFYCG